MSGKLAVLSFDLHGGPSKQQILHISLRIQFAGYEEEWAKLLVKHHQHVCFFFRAARSVNGSGAGGRKSHLFLPISTTFLLFDLDAGS